MKNVFISIFSIWFNKKMGGKRILRVSIGPHFFFFGVLVLGQCFLVGLIRRGVVRGYFRGVNSASFFWVLVLGQWFLTGLTRKGVVRRFVRRVNSVKLFF